jgi:hypothetical protein
MGKENIYFYKKQKKRTPQYKAPLGAYFGLFSLLLYPFRATRLDGQPHECEASPN